MEWIANPTIGDWLRERLDSDFPPMHGVVPQGFPAYARIFHPGFVRELPGRRMPSAEERVRMPAADQERLQSELVETTTTWGDAAAVFGTTLHPLAQWAGIVGAPGERDWIERIAPDGREFSSPAIGELDVESLAALTAVLLRHTSTPDAGVAGLWEGRGGLLGFFGDLPSRGFYTVGDDDPNHRAMLARSLRDPFNNVFRKPTWQEGILSREISEGARLELPNRGYVLFDAPPSAFAEPEWILDAPWRDRPAEAHGAPASAQSPGLLWPDDRAWVMVSEVDYDSTIVAGSAALVAAICAEPGLEALEIPSGADLSWNADEVNR
ncbi:hypothetical protein ACIQTT_10940 [Microbacterium sp. NPDC090225]|uniref:hypothetical protein n=1 Tax=Microbacterium sp. NPDC090225 TaxID=3364207 RepID=UPI0037FC80A1